MGEKRYIISDASKLIDVESHVLRYWEEELDIEIPRNEMGHRYYTDYYIDLFRQIKELKDSGFQLKAIKMVLPELMEGKKASEGKTSNEHNSKELKKTSGESHLANSLANNFAGSLSGNTARAEVNVNDKMVYFKKVMGEIVSDAVRENNQEIFSVVYENGREVSEAVIKQMDYLLRLKEEQEEERYKKLDEVIRNYQKSQKEAAAGKEKKKKRKWL